MRRRRPCRSRPKPRGPCWCRLVCGHVHWPSQPAATSHATAPPRTTGQARTQPPPSRPPSGEQPPTPPRPTRSHSDGGMGRPPTSLAGPPPKQKTVSLRRPAATAQLVPVLLQTPGLVTTDHSSTLDQRPNRSPRRQPSHRQTARSVAWGSTSIWSDPDGSGLLMLSASSIQTEPDGTRRIVWMIKQGRRFDQSSRIEHRMWRLAPCPRTACAARAAAPC